MKTIVSDQHLPEEEIKPTTELGEFRRQLDREFRAFLQSGIKLTPCSCPGCGGSGNTSPAFEKSGLAYLECLTCGSVFAGPRPSAHDLESFYRGSGAVKYWREVLLPHTRASRLRNVITPRVQWILRTIDRYRPETVEVLDVGQHALLNAPELLANSGLSLTIAGPLADLDMGHVPCLPAGVSCSPLENLAPDSSTSVVLAFDALDRAESADGLFHALREVLEPGGILLVGSTLISGFDLQILWDRSDTIYPPERINLLSSAGMMALSSRHGFEILEFSTPGVFDVEIVQRTVKSAPDAGWPRFLRQIAEHGDQEVLDGLQEFLQKYRLSSFGRLALRKI
jgi:hypothetical protein